MPDLKRRFVLALDGREAPSTELVGGKAAQLADLVARDLPVPAAVCVTTDAYRAYLEEHGLDAWLFAQLRRVGDEGPGEAARVAREVRERFAVHPIPPAIAGEIAWGYQFAQRDVVGSYGPVAVRSSASSEDGILASFAGQCETLLNVVGVPSVLGAIVACWSSLHSERALLYRLRHRLLDLECTAGVVVQRLVPADRSAVVFSVNPVDGDRSAVVINATWGLGEAIVSGLVDPDCYIVDKQDGRIRSRQVSDKAIMTVALPDGGTAEQPVLSERRRLPALTDSEITQLADLARRMEAVRQHPVDLECAYDDSALAVLQCRPITTL